MYTVPNILKLQYSLQNKDFKMQMFQCREKNETLKISKKTQMQFNLLCGIFSSILDHIGNQTMISNIEYIFLTATNQKII